MTVTPELNTPTQSAIATPGGVPSPPSRGKGVPTATVAGVVVAAIASLFLLSFGLWFRCRGRNPQILVEPMIANGTLARREGNPTSGYLEAIGPTKFVLRANTVATIPTRKRAPAAGRTDETLASRRNSEPLTYGETRAGAPRRAVDAGPVISSGEMDEVDVEILPPEYGQVFEGNRRDTSTRDDHINISQTGESMSTVVIIASTVKGSRS